jgi:hypothetical protein
MEITWEVITESRIISKTPVSVASVIFHASDTTNNTISLYDGESTSDDLICTLLVPATETKQYTFIPHLVTKKGLYMSMGSNVSQVTIQYGWKRE